MKIRALLFMIFMASCAQAEESDYVGSWSIKPIVDSKDQFPFWMETKYPKVFVVKKDGDGYIFHFTDQFGDTCSGTPMLVNNDAELILEYCGGLGTKSPKNWGPVFHFKMIDGQLHGVATSNIFLFKLIGVRQ